MHSDDDVEYRGGKSPASIGLTVVGGAALLIGLYLLIAMPERWDASSFGLQQMRTFNLHQGFLGMTLAIVGAIFLAAGLRPLGPR